MLPLVLFDVSLAYAVVVLASVAFEVWFTSLIVVLLVVLDVLLSTVKSGVVELSVEFV